jgi:hypothetical protein
MAALLILNMTTCYFGILARSHSRGVRSIVATRLSPPSHAWIGDPRISGGISPEGEHGTNATDVAKSLIEQGIRDAIKEGFLTAEDVKIIQAKH